MTAKFKPALLFLCFTTSLLLTISHNANAQNLFDRIKKKANDALNKKVDKAADDVLNGKKINTTTNNSDGQSGNNDQTSKGRPKFSELKDEDFVQNAGNPAKRPEDTRFRIANNLLIDIKGKYPSGYQPKWRFISYNSNLKFSVEDWLRPKAQLQYEDRVISLGDYGGKAVIRFSPHFDCECFADILIKDSVSVLTENPQVYEVGNFRKILNERSTGEPCVGGLSNAAKGGWGGKITLSANRNGDITMSLMLEDYTLPFTKARQYDNKTKSYNDVFHPAQVNYRFNAKDVTVENEMSAEKATAIIVAEQEAKQRQKDYIAKTTKQADSLQKLIAKKYPQKNCKECFVRNSNSSLKVTPTKTAYGDGDGNVYVESGTDWDINTKTEIKNKCGYDLLFIGLQQMYDEQRGYYLIEVSKTMEKGYDYRSDQGAMASIFSSLIGGGSEFNIQVQDKYYPNNAIVGAVQWIKLVKK